VAAPRFATRRARKFSHLVATKLYVGHSRERAIAMLPFNDQVAGSLAVIGTVAVVLGLLWVGGGLQ
jgi:hypothetical protein